MREPSTGARGEQSASEGAWLPNLVDGVAVWHLASDLNQPRLLGGRLLVPDLEGPTSMPTGVSWHVADYLPLADAAVQFPEDVRAAEDEFAHRVAILEGELSTPGSAFARFRAAFSLPPRDDPGSWFYDPNERALRVANWGATRRRDGAKSVAVHTTARFAKAAKPKNPGAARPPASAGADANASSPPDRRHRAVVGVAIIGTALVLLGIGIISRRQHATTSSAVPDASVAVAASSAPALVADRDRDGTDDEHDECPDLPGTRRGCPGAGTGIVVTRDRISTDELVFFATGSVKLDPKARGVLSQIAKLLLDTPSIAEILVEGHADAVGDADKNFVLSTARALAVRRVLVENGVAESRVRVDAHGASERRVATDAASPENRRVDMRITKVLPTAL